MEGRFVCQWDKDSVDDARFVKIDFLALGMLSAVDDCLDIDRRGARHPGGPRAYPSRQPGDLSPRSRKATRWASSRSKAGRRYRRFRGRGPERWMTSPCRLPSFAPAQSWRAHSTRTWSTAKSRRAASPSAIDYGHPELAPLLEHCLGETLGHVLYQDQVLQISCAVAGFTPGQADRLRRAMSRKRSSDAMQAIAEDFYAGAERQGVSHEAAKVAFDKMAAFAAFGFPKSHAVAFALLAYESTWLRYYYPAAYYCSLFNAQPMGFYSVEVLTGDAKRHGIATLPPEINASRAGAWPEMGDIRLGLQQVNGLGGGWQSRRGAEPGRSTARQDRSGTPGERPVPIALRPRNARPADARTGGGNHPCRCAGSLWITQARAVMATRPHRHRRAATTCGSVTQGRRRTTFQASLPLPPNRIWPHCLHFRPGRRWHGISNASGLAQNNTPWHWSAHCCTKALSPAFTSAACTTKIAYRRE